MTKCTLSFLTFDGGMRKFEEERPRHICIQAFCVAPLEQKKKKDVREGRPCVSLLCTDLEWRRDEREKLG